jgi:hypothetical protein
MARVRNAVVRLEQELQQKRQQSKAVGQVVSLPPSHALDLSPQTRSKTIGFSWHRGFKIGELESVDTVLRRGAFCVRGIGFY